MSATRSVTLIRQGTNTEEPGRLKILIATDTVQVPQEVGGPAPGQLQLPSSSKVLDPDKTLALLSWLQGLLTSQLCTSNLEAASLTHFASQNACLNNVCEPERQTSGPLLLCSVAPGTDEDIRCHSVLVTATQASCFWCSWSANPRLGHLCAWLLLSALWLGGTETPTFPKPNDIRAILFPDLKRTNREHKAKLTFSQK